MHYYGERYKHLYLPGLSCGTENIQRCTPQPDACSNTCQPISVIKSPVPRWQSYTQPLTYVCPQPSITQTPQLSCQPYVQQCVLLYPDLCETAHLLPCRKPSVKLSTMSTFQPCETNLPVKKRVAKSLPPCAPKYPEPTKLKFPPCGIKYSSSCKDECRSQKISKRSSQRYGAELWSVKGMSSGYSPPLRGVTECPPQQCVTQSYLQEYVSRFPQHKCTKGYPTQECVTSYAAQRCATECPPRPCATECPPRPCETKCPRGKEVKESSHKYHATKSSQPQEGIKHKSSGTHLQSKSKCLHPRATQHSSHHHSGGVKRSGHSKKSRCAYKCLW